MGSAVHVRGPGLGIRRLARGRSVESLTLAALLAGAALCLLAGIAFPMSARAPVHLSAWLLGVALAMSAGTLWLGDRVPRWALLVEAVVAAVLNSVIVAASHTTGGGMGDAFAYLWLTAWVALFFPRWAVPFAAVVSGGFAVGLVVSDLGHMTAGWVLVTVATSMLALLLSRFSRAMRRHLRTDALTGTLNRSGLAEVLQRVPRRRRAEDDLVVAALDLDHFKEVNDREGHAAGDRLLAEATAAWRDALRSDDLLARMGGDEFVVVMPGTSPGEAARVLERLRGAHPASWSAGVVRWEAGEPFERCLERADAELYAAKAGRGA